MKQASGRSTEAGINYDLFEMDAHLKECNHASNDRWRPEPLYAARPRRYLAHTVPQPGVEMYTRNVGHGQHANGSREAPDGNEGQRGSTLQWSNGMEFKEGKLLATDGNGLDDDWTTVLGMCADEIRGSCLKPTYGHHYTFSGQKTIVNDELGGSCLTPAYKQYGAHLGQRIIVSDEIRGSCLKPPYGQHYTLSGQKTIVNDEIRGSCLKPSYGQHYTLHGQQTASNRMDNTPRYLRDYPKVTLLGGPLSHTNLRCGNCVPELQTGSCHRPTYWQHDKNITATDFGPGDIKRKWNDSWKESIDDELARHYAKHRLDDVEECPDSADEEVQQILSQQPVVPKVRTLRDLGSIKLNVFDQSSDSESIEVLSGRGDSENEEFLGYYVVDPDGKRRPIPAPRRLVPMPNSEEQNVVTESAVTQDQGSDVLDAELKSGKEVVIAEVRRHRISLSNDSQGRDLSLIPPGFDGHSTHKLMLREVNTLPQQTVFNTLPQQVMFNTLPQCLSTEEAWYQAGPGSQHGQSRFRTHDNPFNAGVVLPEYIGPGPTVALKHTTTKYKPPDPSVEAYDRIHDSLVALATTGFPKFKFRRTRAGLKYERKLGPGLVAPPRRAHLLGNSTGGKEIEGPESTGDPGSTESGRDKIFSPAPVEIVFPSTGMDAISPPRKSTSFTKLKSLSLILSLISVD